MSWLFKKRGEERRKEYERQQGLKMAPVEAPTKQQTHLKEAEEFKAAPVATSQGQLVPLDPKTGKPKVEAKTQQVPAQQKNQVSVKEPETFKPAPIAMTTAPAPAQKQTSKPAAASSQPGLQLGSPAQNRTGLTPAEIQALKAKESALESQVTTARRKFKTLFETDLEEARKTYPAYARKQIGLVDEMLGCADERKDAAAASSYRKLIIEIRREEPPAKTEKPTLDQYLANPSRYGSTVAPKSSYKPTAADVAKQPFQAPKPVCNSLGRYQAAENCKTCRAMADWVHCPCGCGSYQPIDRNYNPFGGEAPPSFKGGNPKGGGSFW